jgi:hypothetical protein
MNYVYPVRILSADGVENAEALLQKQTLQIGLGKSALATFSGKAHILLDFGKERSGGIRILAKHANGRVRIRFGESVSEACAELGDKRNATNDHTLRDFEAEIPQYSDMTLGASAFRFVRIDTLGEDAAFKIKAIVVAEDTDTRAEIGSFSCDDPLINEIWSTAAYTLRLCLHNGYFWDGVKRDRLVWIGDLYPEMRAAHCLYGKTPEVLSSLQFAMEETPLPGWISGMPTYSLWWLINLCDDYAFHGDATQIAPFLPYAKELLKQIDAHVTAEGDVTYPSRFIDWPTHCSSGDPDTVKRADLLCGVHYLSRITMRKVALLLEALGEDNALCKQILARLMQKTHTVSRFKQIAALGVWAGEETDHHRDLLLKDGAAGLSTFMSYPILSAVAAYGKQTEALAMMKDYYGGMLSVGATTFWEDFDLSWLENTSRIDTLPTPTQTDIHGDRGAYCYTGFRHSLCHGWSAGVIPYLTETVVGVRRIGCGMNHLEIRPQLGELKHVRADIPTPYGVVKISHTVLENGEIDTVVNAPDEIRIDICK